MPNQLLCYMYGETSLKWRPKSVKCPHYRGLRIMMERIIWKFVKITIFRTSEVSCRLLWPFLKPQMYNTTPKSNKNWFEDLYCICGHFVLHLRALLHLWSITTLRQRHHSSLVPSIWRTLKPRSIAWPNAKITLFIIPNLNSVKTSRYSSLQILLSLLIPLRWDVSQGSFSQETCQWRKALRDSLYSLGKCIHQTRRVKYDYFQPKKLVFSCIRQEDKNSLTNFLNLKFLITWRVEWPKLSRHKKTYSHIIHSLVVNSENTDKSGWHLILN